MKNRYIIMIMVSAMMLAGCGKKEATIVEKKVIPVKITTAEVREFENNITGEGSVEAKQIAMVTPRIPGTIMELFVKEGDVVEKGDNLFAIDSVKVEQAVVLAKQALAVAKCAVHEKEALKEQAVAVLNKAKIDYTRRKKLFDDKQIGTEDAVERLDSALIQSKASVKHVDTLIQLSNEQVSQAKASLEIAKKDLDDTVIKSPISGVICVRLQDVGDMGVPGQPVFKIESADNLEGSFFIPSQFYSKIVAGKTQVTIFANGKEVGIYTLNYKAPSIDKMLRVFEIKADLGNVEQVAPGSLIKGTIQLNKISGVGVPTKAVIKKRDGDVVFVLNGSVAKLVPIKAGLEFANWTEIADESVKAGDTIVVEGQFLLNDGMSVDIRK
jgi:RND family efflux transporter MFP subunit